MPQAPDPRYLAARCRALSLCVNDDRTIAALKGLAEEYDAEAIRLDGERCAPVPRAE